MGLLRGTWSVLRLLLLPRGQLAVENLALRQQLAVLSRQRPRPRLRRRDRLFWVWLSRWCGGWRSWLAIVRPETVIGWHRQGFRLYIGGGSRAAANPVGLPPRQKSAGSSAA